MLTRKLLSAAALALTLVAPADAGIFRRCRSRPMAGRPVQASPVYVPVTPAVMTPPMTGSTDVGGFCRWLNHLRAQHGRGPVAVDGNLCRDAAVNSSYGFGHSYFGAARRQNAAVGTVATAMAGWVASPAHLSALLDPSITAIGIGQVGQVVTFSAR